MNLRPGIAAIRAIVSTFKNPKKIEHLPSSIIKDDIYLINCEITVPLRVIDGVVVSMPSSRKTAKDSRLIDSLVLVLFDDRIGRRKSPTMPDNVSAGEASYAVLWRFADEEEDVLYNRDKRIGILACVELLRLVNVGRGVVLFEKNEDCRPEYYPLI